MRESQPTPKLARWSGESFGELVLGGELGSGPNGSTYSTTSPEGDGRPYVVKIVERHTVDEDNRMRRYRTDVDILREADITGILEPGAFRTLDNSHLAAIMERTDLLSLRAFRGKLPPHRFIDVLRRIAIVVGDGHNVGCFHGHLHESNIFIDPVEAPPTIEVSGFALHHLINDEVLSPGQLLHDDIFALGLIAFREVSGREYRGPDDLQHLIRESGNFPVRFCQAVERWLDPNPAKRPQKMHQVIGLLEYALASTDPAQTFPVGVAKGPAPAAAIIRPPKTGISEVSEALEDQSPDNTQKVQSWRSCGGKMLWLDDQGVLRRRDSKGNDTIVDAGGLEVNAFAISHDAIAFVVPGGEVHLIEDSGIRRVSQLGRDALAVAPSARLRRIVAATVDGRVWFKPADQPRPLPVGFLNPDDGIDLMLVGERLLVRHGETAWLADPESPDDIDIVFENTTRIDGGFDPRTFVVWSGRRWSLYDIDGNLLETGRTAQGPRPGRMDGPTYSTYRDLSSVSS